MNTLNGEWLFDKYTPIPRIRYVTRKVNLDRAFRLSAWRKHRDAVGGGFHSGTGYAYDEAHTRNIVALLRPALELQCGAPPPG